MKNRDLFGRISCAAGLAFLGLLLSARAQNTPGFTSIQPLANREMALRFTAPAGQVWRMESAAAVSTNPAAWSGLILFQSSNLNLHADSAAPLLDRRYYRARQITNGPGVLGDVMACSPGEAVFQPLGHASLAILWNDTMIYVDPTNAATYASRLPPANLILLTHNHSDHFSTASIDLLRTNGTLILAPPATYNNLTAAQKPLAGQLTNGSTTNLLGLSIAAVPAYNTKNSNHPKGAGNGYILTLGARRVLISGDTDDTPELRAVTNIDAAFLCMRPTYTMTMEEAAAVARVIRPRVVYPYHYFGNDVNTFKALVGQDLPIEARLRKWY